MFNTLSLRSLSTLQTAEAIELVAMEATLYNKRHRLTESPLSSIRSGAATSSSPMSSIDATLARALAAEGHETRLTTKLKRELEKNATDPTDHTAANERAAPHTDATNIKIMQLRDEDGCSFLEIAEMLNVTEISNANVSVSTETPGLSSNGPDVTASGEGHNVGNAQATLANTTPMTGLWTANQCYCRYIRAKHSRQVAEDEEGKAQVELEKQARVFQRKANAAKRRAAGKAKAKRRAAAAAGEDDEELAELTDDHADDLPGGNVSNAGQTIVGGAQRIPMYPLWDDEAEIALVEAIENVRKDYWYSVAVRLRHTTGKTFLPSECEHRFLRSKSLAERYLEKLSRPEA